MIRTNDEKTARQSMSSQIVTIGIAVLVGALLGLGISYFLQAGLVRELLSFGDYVAQVIKVAAGQEEVPKSEASIYWTALVCTLGGAGFGYFLGRKIAGPLVSKASTDAVRQL